MRFNPMKMKFRSKVAAVVMCGAGLALAVPMLPAVGLNSTPVAALRLQSSGTFADGGAVAFATALVACPAGDQPGLSITLTEKSGHAIAQGSGSPPALVCTGGIQTVKVAITPENKPFVAGTAFGQADFFDCNLGGCASSNAQGNVKLVAQKK
jgi:hypothetical protein